MVRGKLGAWALLALLPALACQSTPAVTDGGCVDAGVNTVCGGPQPFPVRFAGLVFPIVDDAGVPQPNVLDVILADHDLTGACGGDSSKLVAFTGLRIEVNGYFLAVDAGTYTAPTASIYEISWVPDAGSAGATDLGVSDNASVLLTSVNGQTSAIGYFNAEMALPQTGLVQLWGDFSAKSCEGLLAALCNASIGENCQN
jgi:hypothetical protein